MKTFARVLSNPDQPDDNEVIEIAQADETWEITWIDTDVVTWLTVEVTAETGKPELGAHWDGKKFGA